jgi:GNAT superfamily N-acetyltransferase
MVSTMRLTTLYNEAIENPVTFTTFDDDGRVTISANVGRTNVGNIIVEQLMNVYWMFEDDMSEDEYDELFPDDTFLRIEHLFVPDDYKDKGYGKALVAQAIQYAKEIGENIIYLNASPMGSSGLNINNLVNFYKSFGFKILPHSDKWSNNKEMILKL